MIKAAQPRFAFLLLLGAGCHSIADGPVLIVESQDVVVHADAKESRLLIACRVRASHAERESQSHLVFALAPNHALALTSVRDGEGRRVGDGAIRVHGGTEASVSYTVIPVELREPLAPNQAVELAFEYSLDLSPPAPDGELIASERDVITPIGLAELRRRLNGSPPSHGFRYDLTAHACTPPPGRPDQLPWIGMSVGRRQEAEDPALQQSFRALEPRSAVTLVYGPYRPIKGVAASNIELAAVPEMASAANDRLLGELGQLDEVVQALLGAPPPSEPLRLLPVPGDATLSSGRTLLLPRAALLAQEADSPAVLETLAINVARAHLVARGLELAPADVMLYEGAARYLGLSALDRVFPAVAAAMVRDYHTRTQQLCAGDDDPLLEDSSLPTPEARRAFGEKMFLALTLLDQELKTESSSRPVLNRLKALARGAPSMSFESFLLALEPRPSAPLVEQLLRGRGPERISYRFAVEDGGRRYRTRVWLSGERDGAFHIPLRIWSPFGEVAARGIPGREATTVEVETTFEPLAVLIGRCSWPLEVELRASEAAADNTAAATVVMHALAAHGGSRMKELHRLSLQGRGTVFDAHDQRREVAAIDGVVNGELRVFGSTQDGSQGTVLDIGPEIFLTVLDLLAGGDARPALLPRGGGRAVLELSSSQRLLAHVELNAGTNLVRRITCFGDQGRLIGHLAVDTYRSLEGRQVPSQLAITLDGRRSPWLSFRAESVTDHRP